MKIANDLVIYEVIIKQNLRAFLDISAVKRTEYPILIVKVALCR